MEYFWPEGEAVDECVLMRSSINWENVFGTRVLLSALLPPLLIRAEVVVIDDDDNDDGDDDDRGVGDDDEDDEDSALSSTAAVVEAIVAVTPVTTLAVATGDSPTVFLGSSSEPYCCRAATVIFCRGTATAVFGPG